MYNYLISACKTYKMIELITLLSVFAVSFGARIPCIVSSVEEYIVGGKSTNITEVPYQASLHLNTRFFCGASIISPTHVVTAAHCVTYAFSQRVGFQIKVGSSQESAEGVTVPVKDYAYHPKFSYNTEDYDVAVLELETPLKFGPTVQPIKLAIKEPADGEIVKASGWGCTKENGVRPKNLQSVEIPMVNRNICEKNYEHYIKITPRMICAGVEGKDTCQGDSGGPLVYKNTLVGIVSTGLGCARKDFPGIYTNVADPDIRQFIQKHSGV